MSELEVLSEKYRQAMIKRVQAYSCVEKTEKQLRDVRYCLDEALVKEREACEALHDHIAKGL